MVIAALTTCLVKGQLEKLPIQIRDSSKNTFSKIDFVRPAHDNETLSVVLFRTSKSPNFPYQVIKENPDLIAHSRFVRKGENGKVESWRPDGTAIKTDDELLARQIQVIFDEKSIGLVTRQASQSYQFAHSGNPLVAVSLFKGPTQRYVGVDMDRLQVLGEVQPPFIDVRLNFWVHKEVAKFGTQIGSKIKVGNSTFRVTDLTTFNYDGRAHVQIEQSGATPGVIYTIEPEIDWEKYTADIGTKNVRLNLMTMPVAGQLTDSKKAVSHVDLSTSIPKAYWKGLRIFGQANIEGYIAHAAARPLP